MEFRDQKHLNEVLRDNRSPLNKARQKFSQYYATLEQAQMQRVPLTPFEFMKLEFEAVEEIIKAYNEQVKMNSMYAFRDLSEEDLSYEEWGVKQGNKIRKDANEEYFNDRNCY
jgi:predicted site-specific integrase-resolvase